MRFGGWLNFLPVAFAPLLLVVGGIAVMVQAKALARICFVTVAVMFLGPALLGPLFAAIPLWVVLPATPFLAIVLLNRVLIPLFGEHAIELAWGRWLSRFMGWLWLAATIVMLAIIGWRAL